MDASPLETMATQVADFAKRKGFCLVKGLYDLNFTQQAEDLLASDPAAALARYRSHPATIAIATALAGPDFDSVGQDATNYKPDPAKLYRQWHNDAASWSQPDGTLLHMWRFAIYFRDYAANSGGLMIRPRSHLGEHTQPISLPSQPGDLVIWNHRTLHAAGAKVNGTPDAYPRNAIFFDIVPLGPNRDRFLEWIRTEGGNKGQKKSVAKAAT